MNTETTPRIHGRRVIARTLIMFRRDHALHGHPDTTAHDPNRVEFEETRPAFLEVAGGQNTES